MNPYSPVHMTDSKINELREICIYIYSSVSVYSSLIDTKHKAVLIKSKNSVNIQNDESNKLNTARKLVIYN